VSDKNYFVYILTNRRNGALYVGVASSLIDRVWEHKNDLVGGHTKRYGIHTLVYYEMFDDIESAIAREKQIKWWRRPWKLVLIETKNPERKGLYEDLI
jgi:putative endonuclease